MRVTFWESDYIVHTVFVFVCSSVRNFFFLNTFTEKRLYIHKYTHTQSVMVIIYYSLIMLCNLRVLLNVYILIYVNLNVYEKYVTNPKPLHCSVYKCKKQSFAGMAKSLLFPVCLLYGCIL